jgi:hypothetical protein
MKTKHTLAPWTARYSEQTGYWCITSGTLDGQGWFVNIAELTRLHYEDFEVCRIEEKANAELIASAPLQAEKIEKLEAEKADLLEALIAAIDFIDKNVGGHICGIDKILSAIAKEVQSNIDTHVEKCNKCGLAMKFNGEYVCECGNTQSAF